MTDAQKAEPQWTPWLVLDDVARPMAAATDQTLDELGDTLLRLQHLRLLEFGQDATGALFFRCRADAPARARALLDDHARARRN
jgi:hypothetical protein